MIKKRVYNNLLYHLGSAIASLCHPVVSKFSLGMVVRVIILFLPIIRYIELLNITHTVHYYFHFVEKHLKSGDISTKLLCPRPIKGNECLVSG
jgi:hypothetical protein